MSLDDRDYYREELARKRGVRPPQPFGYKPERRPVLSTLLGQIIERRLPGIDQERPSTTLAGPPHRAVPIVHRWCRRHRQWLIAAPAIILAGVALSTPPVIMSARCSRGAWRLEPVACWVRTWGALAERIQENMADSRGWPYIVVRTGH